MPFLHAIERTKSPLEICSNTISRTGKCVVVRCQLFPVPSLRSCMTSRKILILLDWTTSGSPISHSSIRISKTKIIDKNDRVPRLKVQHFLLHFKKWPSLSNVAVGQLELYCVMFVSVGACDLGAIPWLSNQMMATTLERVFYSDTKELDCSGKPKRLVPWWQSTEWKLSRVEEESGLDNWLKASRILSRAVDFSRIWGSQRHSFEYHGFGIPKHPPSRWVDWMIMHVEHFFPTSQCEVGKFRVL